MTLCYKTEIARRILFSNPSFQLNQRSSSASTLALFWSSRKAIRLCRRTKRKSSKQEVLHLIMNTSLVQVYIMAIYPCQSRPRRRPPHWARSISPLLSLKNPRHHEAVSHSSYQGWPSMTHLTEVLKNRWKRTRIQKRSTHRIALARKPIAEKQLWKRSTSLHRRQHLHQLLS